jgi:hypothetical protein
MARRPKKIEIPLTGGIDTKTDRKMVRPPKMLDVINGKYDSGMTVEKRNGFTAVPSTVYPSGTVSGAEKLLTVGDGLVAVTGSNMYMYSPGLTEWTDIGDFTFTKVTARPFDENEFGGGTAKRTPRTAVLDGIRVLAWTVGGAVGSRNIYYAIYDDVTGARLSDDTLWVPWSQAAGRVAVVATSTHIVLVGYDRTDARGMFTRAIDVTDLSSADYQNALTDSDATVSWMDAVYHPSDAIIYAHGAGILKWTMGYIGSNGGFNPSGYDTPYTGTDSISSSGGMSLSTNGDTTILAYLTSSNKVYATLMDTAESGGTYKMDYGSWCDTDGLGDNNMHTISAVFRDDDVYTTTVWDLIYTHVDTDATTDKTIEHSTLYHIASIVGDSSNVLAAAVATPRVYGIISDALYPSGAYSDNYIFLVLTGTVGDLTTAIIADSLQSAYTYFDQSMNPVAQFTRGRALYWELEDSVGEIVSNALNHHDTSDSLLLENSSPVSLHGTYDVVTVSADTSAMHSVLRTDEISVVSGGMMWQCNGRSIDEYGFLEYPDFDLDTDTGGSLDEDKTYTIGVEFTAVDELGRIHRSAIVPKVVAPSGVSVPSGGGITWTGSDTEINVYIYPPTTRRDTSIVSIGYSVYVSEANGSILYRLDDQPAVLDMTDNITQVRITGSDIETVNASPYTVGGVLNNIAPFSCEHLVVNDGRVFYSSTLEPYRVYYSKYSDLPEMPGFNEGLYLETPDFADVTGLAVLDDKLVIFTQENVFLVSGEGPGNTGLGAYSEVRQVSTDTGCKDARSIVRIPHGIMFQSDKGIYLLNRGESVSYIGSMVESYNSQTITAATLIADTNEVRFLTDSGRSLVFDYEFGVWSTYDYNGLDAVILDETYHYLRTDGIEVYKEDSTLRTDDGSEVVLTMETPWITAQGANSRLNVGRVMLMGEFPDDHIITIRVYYDFNDTESYNDTITFSAAEQQFRHLLHIRKCKAVKFQFEDNPADGTPSADYKVNGLALEVSSYGGMFKLDTSTTT